MSSDIGPEDLGDLLDQPILAILATRRMNDSILLSPVWFEWRDGGINIWAPPSTAGKVRHIERDPRVTVVIASQELPYKGMEIRGAATLTRDGYLDLVRRTARRYLGEQGDAFADTAADTGTVIRIEPGELRCWDYADEA